MSVEFNYKHERKYIVIILIGLISANLFITLEDSSVIFGLLGIELILFLTSALLEGLTLWWADKNRVNIKYFYRSYWIILVIPIANLFLNIIPNNSVSLYMIFFGTLAVGFPFALGFLIASQIYILRQSSVVTDYEQSAQE